MRVIIVSDIHGNLAALKAVLEDARSHWGIGELWCLGDIVGYGPEPGACIELLAEHNAVAVAGNHDRGAIGKLELAFFNPNGAAALLWTMEQLKPEHRAYLEALPLTRKQGDFLLVHGSPVDPLLEYMMSASIAEKSFDLYPFKYCLNGHTHLPVAYRNEEKGVKTIGLQPNVGLVLGDMRMIINPGSAGQPRDGDPRAAYGVYDTDSGMFRLQRAEYDIKATQDGIMAAGLPVRLATRLEQGR